MLREWIITWALAGIATAAPLLPDPVPGTTIVLVGNGLGAQMLDDGAFETLLHQSYPDHQLRVRNLCVEGDTAAYRPRAGRDDPWAFPGAEKLRPEFRVHRGQGIEPSPDQWLAQCKADVVLGFFGYNESFDGDVGVGKFKAELTAWIAHTKSQRYNGTSAPSVVLVSPIAHEDRSRSLGLPDGVAENARLERYATAMAEVAAAQGVGCVDLFTPTRAAMARADQPLTRNGFLPNAHGNRLIAEAIVAQLFGKHRPTGTLDSEALRQLVVEKGWMWKHDYRILNGVHVYGRRRAPFGTVSYPPEIEKTRQLVANREQAVWAAAQGKPFDLAAADARTPKLPEIQSNFRQPVTFKGNAEALDTFELMEGFKIELFATESEFPDLRNPVQMSFDNHGRLWVAVAPSYPAWRPGDPKPNDKLIVFEDSNGDGKADRQSVFADGLHLPMGFELAAEGVYVAQQPDLVLLKDTDRDGKADHREVILRGFDPHDTHHAIGAFCVDPMGGLYMPEGIFLHSQVETAHGPRRDTYSGMWRFDPHHQRLERFSQSLYANPWGVAFDDWGQCFLSDASTGQNWWQLPLSAKVPPGVHIGKTGEFAPKRSRPTSGSEFVSSRHFPDELQGAFLLNNVIGFQGTSIHDIRDDGSGIAGKHRGDLLLSNDPNFRPVDLEFAPDGSLYLVDWHNPLIGHMQHSARDPKRDHDHGRIYRITCPSRPLVKPPQIAGASVPALLKALEEPEIRTRYRARRELRGHPAEVVVPAVHAWLDGLDPTHPRHEPCLAEALWVTAGAGQVDAALLNRCLASPAYQVRAAAVDVIRFRWQDMADAAVPMLLRAAVDEHPRVRLAAMVAASWLDNPGAAWVAMTALERPVDKWMGEAYKATLMTLADDIRGVAASPAFDAASMPRTREFLDGKLKLGEPPRVRRARLPKLAKADMKLYQLGEEVFRRDSHCATCHQADGKGDKIYPPLAGSEWVAGNQERLIKLVLKGVWGPITVKGETHGASSGVPPMMPFEHLLNDRELAGVLTYVRNSFGNRAPAVTPETVRRVRAEVKDKQGFYMVEDLLRMHPME